MKRFWWLAIILAMIIAVPVAFAGVQKAKKPVSKPVVHLDVTKVVSESDTHYMGYCNEPNRWCGLNTAADQYIADKIASWDIPAIENFVAVTVGEWEQLSYVRYWPGREAVGYSKGSYERLITYHGTFEDEELVEDVTLHLTQDVTIKAWAEHRISPIVLDLDGNGRLDTATGEWRPHTLRKHVGGKYLLTMYDINGDNVDELVEWIGPSDGFLVMPKDVKRTMETGVITADEMFGTAGGYTDGYSKLSLLDRNGDKFLTGDELNGLYIWQDKNSNTLVDKGELVSVTEVGITKICIRHSNYASYFIMNGKTYRMWDWWPITMMIKKSK